MNSTPEQDRETLLNAVPELEAVALTAEEAAQAADRLWFGALARRLRSLAQEMRATAIHIAIQSKRDES